MSSFYLSNARKSEYTLQFVETIPSGCEFVHNTKKYPSIGESLIHRLNFCRETLKIISFYYSLKISEDEIGFVSEKDAAIGEEIYKQLDLAAKRGVKIQFIANVPVKGFDSREIVELCNQNPENASIRFVDMSHKTQGYTGGVCHTKLWIFDDYYFFLGSANADWRAYSQNVNTGFIGESCPELLTELKAIFEETWNMNEQDPTKDENLNNEINSKTRMISHENYPVTLSTSPSLITQAVGTTDDRIGLLNVIKNAKERLYISSYKMSPASSYCHPSVSDDSIHNEIISAAVKRNIEVRIIVNYDSLKNKEIAKGLKILLSYVKIEVRVFKMNYSSYKKPADLPYTKIWSTETASSESRIWLSTNYIDPDSFVTSSGIGLNLNSSIPAYSKVMFQFINDVNAHFMRYWNSEYVYTLEEDHLAQFHSDI